MRSIVGETHGRKMKEEQRRKAFGRGREGERSREEGEREEKHEIQNKSGKDSVS